MVAISTGLDRISTWTLTPLRLSSTPSGVSTFLQPDCLRTGATQRRLHRYEGSVAYGKEMYRAFRSARSDGSKAAAELQQLRCARWLQRTSFLWTTICRRLPKLLRVPHH